MIVLVDSNDDDGKWQYIVGTNQSPAMQLRCVYFMA
jgi:hypothetical protein